MRVLQRDADYTLTWIRRNRYTQEHEPEMTSPKAYATEFCNSAESNAMAAMSPFEGFILHQTFATCQALCSGPPSMMQNLPVVKHEGNLDLNPTTRLGFCSNLPEAPF